MQIWRGQTTLLRYRGDLVGRQVRVFRAGRAALRSVYRTASSVMPLADENCIFCQIAAGAAPASVVFRDDLVIAFMDVQPVNAGQVLVVPIDHAPNLSDLDPSVGGRMFQVAQRTAAAVRASGIRCEGVNLFLADGAVAMQEVFHVHLHVIPRFDGDGFGLKYGPSNFKRLDREQLDRAASLIRAAATGGA